MTTLLKPGIKKILQVFYENQDQKLHLREIARRTKLYGQSVTRYLHELERERVLAYEKEGNLKKYHLTKTKTVYALLTLFDLERFEQLPELRKNALIYYFDKLEEKPVFAVLFGSTAKGTYRKESDIDLLLVTNRRILVQKAEREADALTAIKVSTFQMTLTAFRKEIKLKEDSVVQSAINSGYPIFNQITYYEAFP